MFQAVSDVYSENVRESILTSFRIRMYPKAGQNTKQGWEDKGLFYVMQ